LKLLKTSILIIACSFGASAIYAQSPDEVIKRSAIKMQIGESVFAVNEINIGFEQSISSFASIEVNVGYIPKYNYHKKCIFLSFEQLKLPYVNEGYVMRISYNLYSINSTDFINSYSFTLLYKDVSAKNVQYDPGCFSGGHDTPYELFSQDTKDYGGQITFNKSLLKAAKSAIIDFYLGLGFRVRQIKKMYHLEGIWSDKIPSDRVENKTKYLPSFHIGIRMGLNFVKNKKNNE